jgi:hypothetical protein
MCILQQILNKLINIFLNFIFSTQQILVIITINYTNDYASLLETFLSSSAKPIIIINLRACEVKIRSHY